MKLKFLASIVGGADARYDLADFSFAPGDVAEIHPTLAEAWIASGVAEAVPAPKKAKK